MKQKTMKEMKERSIFRILPVFLFSTLTALLLSACSSLSEETANQVNQAKQTEQAEQIETAVYLGVSDYGQPNGEDKDSFKHRFSIDGKECAYTILCGEEQYPIQNILQEGYVYDITIENEQISAAAPSQCLAKGKITDIGNGNILVANQQVSLKDAALFQISSQAGGSSITAAKESDLAIGKTIKVYPNENGTSIFLTFVADPYNAPVAGTPGLKTLKNFFATALEPVGTTLYVYGGAWDWQDVGSSSQATTIGLPQSWVDFFQSHGTDYTYKNEAEPGRSYYPHGAWNQYYYAGADCSGYLGWTLYNLMHTESGGDGYVQGSTGTAESLANRGWGTKTQDIQRGDFKPGDIFSMNGHVWICLGACEDGSLVILHSSLSNEQGGGPQINGVGDDENCQAVQLAKKYMSAYYPQWMERYPSVYKNYTQYTTFTGEKAGKFSWSIGDGQILSDPDGYAAMSAGEILADLFDE